MNGLVHEWVEKAEGDFQSAQRELRARKAPNYDAARAAIKAMRTVRAFVRSK